MNKKGKYWISFGFLLIAMAVCLIGYNTWCSYQAGREAKKTIEQMDIVSDEETETGYPDYILNPMMAMPIEIIDGYEYIGILTIPKLNLELPIINQWDYPKLKVAPCRYEGSCYLDHLIICGHNYDSHFGRLGKLAIGDLISFCDIDGNIFSYEVAEVEVLEATAIEEMKTADWDLSLFTCTIGGKTRLTVRCERIEKGIF